MIFCEKNIVERSPNPKHFYYTPLADCQLYLKLVRFAKELRDFQPKKINIDLLMDYKIILKHKIDTTD